MVVLRFPQGSVLTRADHCFCVSPRLDHGSAAATGLSTVAIAADLCRRLFIGWLATLELTCRQTEPGSGPGQAPMGCLMSSHHLPGALRLPHFVDVAVASLRLRGVGGITLPYSGKRASRLREDLDVLAMSKRRLTIASDEEG
jgi:hypothetical protein